jgi:hypothetical protein
MKWPDFIIIGGHKCGTTQLFLDLNKHPDITMSVISDIKPGKAGPGVEMLFWSTRWGQHDIKWYKQRFSGGMSGEKSANYYNNKKAMRRIHKHIPDVKLILCVRNPIDRAHSHFQKLNRKGLIPGQSVLMNNYVKRGYYYRGIQNCILPHFDRNQIHIVINEWMRKDPNKELRKIHRFLGVEEFELPVERVSEKLKYRKGVTLLYEDSKKGKYTVWQSDHPPIGKSDRKKLVEIFKPHNEDFFEFLGFEIEEWSEGN